MVTLVMKKKAKTDGRDQRYAGFSTAEIRQYGETLQEIGGKLMAVADEAEAIDLKRLPSDGRKNVIEAVKLFQELKKQLVGTLAAEQA